MRLCFGFIYSTIVSPFGGIRVFPQLLGQIADLGNDTQGVSALAERPAAVSAHRDMPLQPVHPDRPEYNPPSFGGCQPSQSAASLRTPRCGGPAGHREFVEQLRRSGTTLPGVALCIARPARRQRLQKLVGFHVLRNLLGHLPTGSGIAAAGSPIDAAERGFE